MLALLSHFYSLFCKCLWAPKIMHVCTIIPISVTHFELCLCNGLFDEIKSNNDEEKFIYIDFLS